MGIDEFAHLLVISLQDFDGLLRLRGFAECREPADVAEQDAEQRPVA